VKLVRVADYDGEVLYINPEKISYIGRVGIYSSAPKVMIRIGDYEIYCKGGLDEVVDDIYSQTVGEC